MRQAESTSTDCPPVYGRANQTACTQRRKAPPLLRGHSVHNGRTAKSKRNLRPKPQSSAAGGLQERNTQNQPEGPPVRYSSLFSLLGPQFDSRLLFSLLVFLLPLPVHIKFLLLAPELRRGFPLEIVPVDR